MTHVNKVLGEWPFEALCRATCQTSAVPKVAPKCNTWEPQSSSVKLQRVSSLE